MADTKKLEEEQGTYVTQDVPALRTAPAGVLEEGSLDPVYEAKAKILVSKLAIQGLTFVPFRLRWTSSKKPLKMHLFGF